MSPSVDVEQPLWAGCRGRSPALPCMNVDDPARVHVQEVKDLVGHGVEAGPWLDIVVVVVSDVDA